MKNRCFSQEYVATFKTVSETLGRKNCSHLFSGQLRGWGCEISYIAAIRLHYFSGANSEVTRLWPSAWGTLPPASSPRLFRGCPARKLCHTQAIRFHNGGHVNCNLQVWHSWHVFESLNCVRLWPTDPLYRILSSEILQANMRCHLLLKSSQQVESLRPGPLILREMTKVTVSNRYSSLQNGNF